MNFLKQSMGGAVRQGGALPPQLMGAIQDIKRMQAVCGGNMQAMINQVAAQRPEIGQALTAVASPLILGAVITDTGISLTPSAAGITVNKSGLYRISADVTITSTAAGIVNLQAYINGVARPETLRAVTVPAAGNTVVHLETVAYISACCAINPIITIVGNTEGAAAGSISLIAVNVIKEA